jgi:signal transduction histidine kinase
MPTTLGATGVRVVRLRIELCGLTCTSRSRRSTCGWTPGGRLAVSLLTMTPARRVDVALAAGLLAAGQLEIWVLHSFNGAAPAAVAATVLSAVPLAWRRQAPLAVALVVAAGLGVTAPASGLSQFLAVLVAVYSAAGYASLPRAGLGLGAALVAQATAIAVGPDPQIVNVLYAVGLYGAAWLAGLVVRRRATQIATLHSLAAELRDQQEALARVAIAAERARMARELHDVIAHSVSVIVLQAGAAEQLLEADPTQARSALAAVQEVGEQTAAELRRLLGVIRLDTDTTELGPQPGLADVPRLVDQLRRGGLAVTLDVVGPVRPLPPGVDLAAYRVIQEALTNVVKHARATTVDVRILHTTEDVRLVVRDDGKQAAARPERGRGLAGMRERCALYGGELTVDAGPGGRRVEARLPRSDRTSTAPALLARDGTP